MDLIILSAHFLRLKSPGHFTVSLCLIFSLGKIKDEIKYYNIVIAGSEDWFLEGSGWVFKSNKKQLNQTLFETWFTKVVDALEDGVVVMKKASYNSR